MIYNVAPDYQILTANYWEKQMTYKNKKYDKDLRNILHYKQHPQMIPFVGRDWDKMGKMLVVGESHYLNDDEKRENRNTWKNWYNITKKELTNDQSVWTSTACMINADIKGNFFPNGHRIWKNVRDAIVETGFNPNGENPSEALYSIAFMNFFQRPALESGESITYDENDIRTANSTLNGVVNAIGANYIFFVSSTAWDNFDKELFKDKIIGHSCHPTSHWWNRESEQYTKAKSREKITGKESFKYFIKKNINI
ncbi:hypothetical protein [Treponema endosymbiont of Eucomonympha sp.]|uniref:hypothetical protein n=1 Tax=Treponema endosymbiont of Eucomonympha sp. TaxID=1580831 RepID=UPI0007509FCF|nr:hypothetical protein [Treponema endosymbiont of Eucomonympha sp.]